MANAPSTLTNPAAGVTATRPATQPENAPSKLGLPRIRHSSTVQDNAADAEATCVFTKAVAASPLAASALPALNPNRPNHSRPAPSTVSVMLCGSIFFRSEEHTSELQSL